ALRDVLVRLRATPRLLGTAAMIGVITIGAGGAYQYEGALLKDLGATDFIVGVAGMLGAVIEIPFMGILDRLMRRVSAYRLLIAGMLIYVGLRGIVFLFPSIGVILLAAAGIGISYSLLIIPLTRFIADQAGEAHTPMMLAFINVTLPGVISLISSPLTGWLYDTLGARALYGLAAISYLTAALALAIAARWPAREPAPLAASG
ncbi:MAG: MFS transporter, partial [Anaerolinea sp.]|nr:MFS transporter [Anaerolinea sp.]